MCVENKMTYTFSPSTLNIFKDCPRCFWLQFKKGVKRPAGPFPSLPSGMDSVLKKHFDSFMKKKMLPPELSSLKGVEIFNDEEKLKVWRSNLKGIQWKDKKGNVLRGAIDLLLKKGNKLIVADFKTRGFPLKEDSHEHYIDQLNIYNFLFRKNGYETEEYSYLLFYHPKEVLESGDVAFNNDLIKIAVDVKSAEKLFKDAIKCLKGKMPKAGEECEFCKFAKERK